MTSLKILTIILTSSILFACGGQERTDKIVEQKTVNEFDAFIPAGYSILFQATGDLDLDSIADKILILNKKGEDTLSTTETPIKRILLVLLGQADKSFKFKIQNSNIIYFYGYDLNFKDAFVDLTIKPGQFSVDHYGGFAQRWGRTTTFKYNNSEKNWYLFTDEFSTFDATDPENTTKEKIHTEKNFGKVAFDKFDIYKEWE